MNHPNADVYAMHTPTPPRSYVPRPNAHSALPNDVCKTSAIATVARALNALALPNAVIAAWRLIADQTEALAWHSDAATPMNYRKAKDLARALGVSDRHWRRIEVQLEQAGVIYRATTENGFRGKAAQGTLTFGLSLEPALAHFAKFTELAERSERQERERKLCLGQIRALRKRLSSLASFDPLTSEHQALWDTVEQDYRPSRPGFAEHRVLARYLNKLQEIENILRTRYTLPLEQDLKVEVGNAGPDTAHDQAPLSNALPRSFTSVTAHGSEIQEPTRPAAQNGPTSTKMSGAADSDVRCQYNLNYKIKRLNDHSQNFDTHEKMTTHLKQRISPNQSSEETISDPAARSERTTGNPTVQPKGALCGSALGERRQPHSPATDLEDQTLHSSHKLDLAKIANMYHHPSVLADIKTHKAGSPCAALDPQHIWDRFKRYNLKRDKKILPIAALRAFIKGWIPDGPLPYLATAVTPTQGGSRVASGLTPSHQSTRKPIEALKPRSREEVLAFYAKAINSGRYIPQTMISPAIMRELRVSGLVAGLSSSLCGSRFA